MQRIEAQDITGRRYTVARVDTPRGRFLDKSGNRYDLVRRPI